MGERSWWAAVSILNQWYWIMPNMVLYSNELSDKQKLLYCLISSLCAEKWYCRATNKYLWNLLWVKEWSISTWIKKLIELWLIDSDIDQNKWNERHITISNVENHNRSCEKSQEGSCEKSQDNITIENITNENKENKKKKKYLDYVYLSDDEYINIQNRYWERILKDFIERLDNWIWENPDDKKRKKKSHYHTILNRIKRAWIKEIPKKQLSEYEIEEWVYDLDKLLGNKNDELPF